MCMGRSSPCLSRRAMIPARGDTTRSARYPRTPYIIIACIERRRRKVSGDLLLVLQGGQLVGDLSPRLDALGVAGALELFDSLFDDPRRPLAIPSPARASIDGGGVIKAGIHRRYTRSGWWSGR